MTTAQKSGAVLITGAGRGIGAATARLAAARGWSVGVNYRSRAAEAEALVQEIRAAGGEAAALQADISEPTAIEPLFDRAETALGPLRGVVANAGILRPVSPLAETTPEEIARILRVNVEGALLTAREAARRLTATGRSGDRSVVLISSTAVKMGSPGEFVDYAASKAAIDVAAIGLARELGPHGVRVNAVRPGLIDTEMQADSGLPDRLAALAPNIPLRRGGRPEEVAAAVLFLLSDEASYVSGAVLDVSGGR